MKLDESLRTQLNSLDKEIESLKSSTAPLRILNYVCIERRDVIKQLKDIARGIIENKEVEGLHSPPIEKDITPIINKDNKLKYQTKVVFTEKTNCRCGGSFDQAHRSNHYNTKRHQKFVKATRKEMIARQTELIKLHGIVLWKINDCDYLDDDIWDDETEFLGLNEDKYVYERKHFENNAYYKKYTDLSEDDRIDFHRQFYLPYKYDII